MSLIKKVSQSISRFNALDQLIMTVHSVRMPVGFGRGIKSRGRPLSVMAHLKRSVVEVKASENCLAHAIILAIAKVVNDPDYKAYRQGRKIRPVVQKLLDKTGIDLSGGGGIPELLNFQKHFREYKITVYQGLAYEDIMFEGQVDSPKKINLLYDDVEQHYHVIVNITGAMAKYYVKHVRKGTGETLRTCVTKRVAIVWRDPRAPSPLSEFPAPNVIDILGSKRVSRTTNRVRRIRIPFMDAGEIALRVGPS
jgi:hypothetical protein